MYVYVVDGMVYREIGFWGLKGGRNSSRVKKVISVEYHIQPLGLPSHFNGYFTQTLDKLLAKDTISKKKWFQLIRRAREVRNLTIRDAFHTNTILRNWVHLPTTA